MALTKITGQVINTATDVTVGVLTVTNTLAVGGTVSIGGTLTYEDVTNIDSVGLITARNGIVVGSGITLSKDGDIFATGVTTATTFVGALTGNVTGNVTGNISGGTVAGSTGTFTGDVDIADKIVHTGDTDTAIRFAGADTITAETGGSERVRIDSSGRLLVGTTVPTSFNGAGGNHNLVVAGDSNDTDITDNYNAAITISNKDGTANNTAGLHFAREDTDGNPHYDGASVVAQFKETMNTGQYPKTDLVFLTSSTNNAAPSEKVRIDSSGNVLIGSSSLNNSSVDGQALQIKGTTRPTLILRGNADDNQVAEIQFADNSGSDDSNTGVRAGLIQYSHASNFLAFRTSATERLRIDSSGRVLMGTTDLGSSNADNLTVADSGNCGITIRSGNTSTGNIFWSDATSGAAQYAAALEFHHNDNTMNFNIANAVKVKIHSGGETNFNNGIVLGNGVTYAAGNTLNDYESGNWTPTSDSGGWTIHTNYYSKYTKVGTLVHAQFYIGINGTPNTSSIVFGGLPFNSESNGYSVGSVDFGKGSIKGTYSRVEGNSDQLYFFYPSENTSLSRLPLVGNQVATNYVIGTITYYTAA